MKDQLGMKGINIVMRNSIESINNLKTDLEILLDQDNILTTTNKDLTMNLSASYKTICETKKTLEKSLILFVKENSEFLGESR